MSSIPHTPPIAYNQAGGTAVSVNTDDVWSPIVNLPFNFCYYGVNYTTVNIGSNGSIQFGPISGGGFNPWSFTASCPSTALVLAGDVYGVYHDTDPSVGGTIKWYLLGTAPCRIMVVSYNNVPHYLTSCNNLTSRSMIVLYETTNAIDVYVESKPLCNAWNNGNAIIGIQNPAGTAGIAAPGRNTGTDWVVTTPEGWRFTPNGAPNYAVAWYQGPTQIGTGNTINVCPGGPTTYTAQVTYNRCDGTQVVEQDQVNVSFQTLTAATVTPTNETCQNYNNGSVVIDNPVGSGPYTVAISGPTTGSVVEPNTAGGTASFTNLPDGNYSYTVTGSNGCTTSGTFTIAPGPLCCSVTASGTNVACNSGTTGTTTAAPVGVAPFAYSWTGGQTGQTATNLAAGTYTVTLTDNTGCTATANVTITAPPALSATAVQVNTTCNGSCNGSLTITPSGGTAPYQYSLDGGAYQGGNAFPGLCAGAHSVTVRDANNCTFVITRTITQPAPLTITVPTIVPATCGNTNGSITAAASGGTTTYTYTIGATSHTSPVFPNMAPGTYTVSVTDANGCTNSTTAIVTAVNAPIASVLSQQNVSCFGGVNGSVLIGATGGVAPITYSLNAGPFQSSNSFGTLSAGTYTVTVRDANLCTATVTFTITSPTQLTYTTVASPALCNAACNGQIQVNATGGTAPYQYSSNNGATYAPANPITGLCAGVVSIVVQDANGCLANSSVNITQPAPLSATFTHTDPVCNGACDGSIVVTPAGGTPAYQYAANGGALQASNTLAGVCGGNNSILVQDSHGCQFTATEVLTDPPGFGIDTVVIVESNCGFNNGSITVQANGTNGPFLYSLEGGPNQASGLFSNLLGGAYSIVATDQLGCQEQVFFGINDVEMDGIVLLQTDAICYGSPDGAIEVTNVSGAPPITFELDNSGATQTNGIFNNLTQGSHVVTIYDGGLCVFTIPFMTNEPPQIVFGTTVTNVLCNGGNTGAITFTGVGGGTGTKQFSIDGGATYQAGTTFGSLSAGTYNLAVIDANNCVVTGTATITQAPALTLAYSKFDLTCFGNSSGFMQLAGGGGTGAYQYSIDNGTTFSTNDSYFSLAAGTYNIMVQDAVGCQTPGTVTLAEPAALSATYAATAALCQGVCDGELAITASGGTTPYQYSVDNGTTFVVASTITGLCANTYSVMIKDSNNCTITSSQAITEPAGVSVIVTITDATCSSPNGEIDIAASGGLPGYNYSIDNGGTFVATNNFTDLAAGPYTVVVTDQNDCPVTSQEVVNNMASPSILGAFITNVSCNAVCDGEVFTSTTGGTGPLTFSAGGPAQSDSTIAALCAGTHLLTVTDQNNCTDTQTIVITEPAPLTLNANVTDLTCFGNNSGTITFTGAGGTPAYVYSTDNGATYSNQTLAEFLPAGTYNLYIKDQNDCMTPASVLIAEPPLLEVQSQVSNDATCHGECNGDATVTMTGGTGAYDYDWSNGSTGTNAVTGLCAGTYDVTISDANACEATATFLITEPPMLTIVSVSSTDVLCNGDCNGTIMINCPSAVDYSVDNGATFQGSNFFNGLCPGTYAIVVRDATGCTQTESITINQPQPLVQNLIPEDGVTICFDGFGTLSASATGGTTPYYFIWNTGDTVQYLNVNLTIPATFTCTVVDQNGCVSNAASADVAIRPKFIASVTTPVSVCPGQLAAASASGIDGLPGYEYQWLTQTFDTLGSGTDYSYLPTTSETILMVGHDACFLYDTLEVDIVVFDDPQPDFTVTPSVGCSPLDAIFTNTSLYAAGASCIWTWGDGSNNGNGSTNVSHQYTEVGCYDVTLEVTSADGCVGDTTLQNVVCVVPDPVADFSFSPQSPTTVNSQVNFTDQSTNAESWDWDFDTYGSSNLENPMVNYGNVEVGEQLVCLLVTSPEGCTNEICKPIPFVEELMIFVPNTFTPDDDEYNPVFTPVLPPGITVDAYTLYIFDRWGEILFESHDWNIGWDGNYQGETVKEGVYTWTIQMTGGPNRTRLEMEGHVNVIR